MRFNFNSYLRNRNITDKPTEMQLYFYFLVAQFLYYYGLSERTSHLLRKSKSSLYIKGCLIAITKIA